MDLSNLKPAKGSVKKNLRLGRGQGSARGGTSARGHKGQKSRSGYSKKIGFEGGQQPIQRRLPKFGFTNINRVEFKGINLDTLQFLAETKKLKKIGKEDLVNNGLAAKKDLIKILGRGELTIKIDVAADAFSKSALAVLEKLGGKVEILREPKKKKRTAKKSAPKPETKTESKEVGAAKEKENAEAVEDTNGMQKKGNAKEAEEEMNEEVTPEEQTENAIEKVEAEEVTETEENKDEAQAEKAPEAEETKEEAPTDVSAEAPAKKEKTRDAEKAKEDKK